MGVRTRSAAVKAGTAGLRMGWKDQKARSSAVRSGPGPTASGSGRRTRAPPAIQRPSTATSAGVNFFLFPGGMSPSRTRW